MSLISDEIICYEKWLWDREVGIINRLDLFQRRVKLACPFSICPVEIEVGDCEFVDGGGI